MALEIPPSGAGVSLPACWKRWADARVALGRAIPVEDAARRASSSPQRQLPHLQGCVGPRGRLAHGAMEGPAGLITLQTSLEGAAALRLVS